ncbi:MarR family transcriptional regulator [Nocardia puris]|uniref:DNA-binding MarR family transcriptional regulator n=1 Tax=Nocardia puris TaxID=208602 RepID=A0A366E2D4_9NOCA|nr:MarR family transcriptional regulator [Nocardia puris]MBF6212651.1 MarR family transcriptional regulator [Nocardia puris]MBF6367589.1 MarR family transcriptional regulator [Nocardia puris]MBF6461240.1 MarR family transcriptional regulator [Nocardia puris]RBO96531.1 DNA-binding MarR family transcriptional regulator [Nocardia puris]
MPKECASRDQVAGLAARLAQLLDAHSRAVAEQLGITTSQVVALRELDGPMTLRELATRMACEASNATYVADRMEAQSLIRREPHPRDRRSKQVVLTESGERCRANVLAALSARSPLDALDAGEQEQLSRLLSKAVDSCAEERLAAATGR